MNRYATRVVAVTVALMALGLFVFGYWQVGLILAGFAALTWAVS
jgi:hypothetical protein